jgi:hypothetical protein
LCIRRYLLTWTTNRDSSVAHGGNARLNSENISFRLPKVLLDQLRLEAEERNTTLNALINQIIDSYVNFALNAPKAGLLPVHRFSQALLLDGYSEDHIKEKAKCLMKAIRVDTPLVIRGKYDFEAVLDNYCYWLKTSCFKYRHSKDAEGNTHTFIIEHDTGRKFSVYAAESSRAYFEPVVTKEVEYSITDNCIMLVVEGKVA